MSQPLVSVICLSYNHARFLREAAESILTQTYRNIEIILVDDASTDHSADVIKQLQREHPQIKILLLSENIGNCKAFNKALALSTGEFVIDFAADDVLLPNRVSMGVVGLLQATQTTGVHFCDAEWINESGQHLYYHSDKFPHDSIPQGNIYTELIKRYFICPASTLCKKEVLNKIEGYDESLQYEDFDFLIRSSYHFQFIYSPEVLVKKRVTQTAMSRIQLQLFNRHTATTYAVCKKILLMNRTSYEKKSLTTRLLYELQLNIRLLNFGLAAKYVALLLKNLTMRYGA
jgi:glycosyltransferase involved in cell wall biosynthesis